MDEELKKTLVEARAMIIWGNPLSEVREWLKKQNLSDSQIATVIRTCMRERTARVRAIGMRDVAIGSLLVLSVGLVFLISPVIRWRAARIYTFIVAAGICGLWLVCRGIGRLIDGANERGSITDM